MKKALNNRYDLRGSELSRVGKITLFSKLIPTGNMRGGPGARCLFTLAVLHYFGGSLYWVQARYGHQLRRVRKLVGVIS